MKAIRVQWSDGHYSLNVPNGTVIEVQDSIAAHWENVLTAYTAMQEHGDPEPFVEPQS